MVLSMGPGVAQLAEIKPVERIYDGKMIATAFEKSTLGQ